jgi:ferredoxin-NADP reductase
MYARFESTGRLVFEESTITNRVICNCLQVDRKTIKGAVKAGSTRLVELQERLGCGTVCGGCIPTVRQLLGHEQWAPVRIVEEHQLTGEVRRFRLRPVGRPMASALPGQHVVLTGLVDGEWVRRSYTLTSAGNEPDHYEILVKREPKGVFSGWLFEEAGEDSLLRISPPQGDYHWQPNGTPVVCLVAGIGITPALAMLRSRQRERWSEPLHIDLSVRSDGEMLCSEELSTAAAGDERVSVAWRVTGKQGRIQQSDVDALNTRFAGAAYYLCGPVSYMDSVRAMLQKAGVPAPQIRVESFTPAGQPAAKTSKGKDGAGKTPEKKGGLAGLFKFIFGKK